jgi:hypothetical protein
MFHEESRVILHLKKNSKVGDMGRPARTHGVGTPSLYLGEAQEDRLRRHPKDNLYKEKTCIRKV